MHYKIAQFIKYPGNKHNSLCDIYIAQPDSNKEALAGKLFVVLEIKLEKKDSIKILNFLIDSLNYNYYNNEKIILREKISSLKIEHIFEATLAKVNTSFNEFIKNEKIEINYNDINITTGVIYEKSLHFANCGKNKIFLIYKTKNKEKKQRSKYKIFDLTKEDKDNSKRKIKLFSNVISGNIPAGSYTVMTNEAFPEYISNNQLIETITKLPPLSAVEQLKNKLSSINAYIPFMAVIIKSTSVANEEMFEQTPARSSEDSIHILNNTEDTTEKYLTPSGIINFKKWFKFPFSGMFSRKQQKQNNQQNLGIKDRIVVKRKSFLSINKIFILLKNLFINLANILFYIAKIITNKEKFLNFFKNISSFIKNKTRSVYSFIIGLNSKKKILALIFVVVIIIFVVNISIKNIKKENEILEKQVSQLMQDIEQKENQIDAFLLYNNQESAKKAFIELEELMGKITEKNIEENHDKYNAFKEKFYKYQDSFRKVEEFIGLEELANFDNLNLGANAENIIQSLETNKIYASDSSQKSIYILDIESNAVTTVTDIGDTIKNIKLGVKTNDLIYYYNNDSIIAFSIDNEKIINLPISNTETNENIISIDTYNSRLYTLDPVANEIYRYDRGGNAFSNPKKWLVDNVDLSNAVDISIDGHIYALEKNGNIIKLLKGELQDLILDDIDPLFTDASKFFVSTDQKFIYILEPANNRLVIYDKTGKFILQYKDEKLANAKDFTIDEKNNIIYFLSDNTVYKATGKHFRE